MARDYIEKFPATSKNGNEYLVVITNSRFFNRHVEVMLCEKIEKKSILGKRKIKLRKLNEDCFGNCTNYNEETWDCDYKKMAITEVNDYEKDIEEREKFKLKQQENRKAFKEWDGKVDG